MDVFDVHLGLTDHLAEAAVCSRHYSERGCPCTLAIC